MAYDRRGYHPDMIIEDHDGVRTRLEDYAKKDPTYMVARLCDLSAQHYKLHDKHNDLTELAKVVIEQLEQYSDSSTGAIRFLISKIEEAIK